MRKFLFLLVAVVATLNVRAADFTVDGVEYDIVDLTAKTARVVGLSSDCPAKITIPETVEYSSQTLSIVGIGDASFRENMSLQKISFPEAITEIPEKCFYNCTSLTDVTFVGEITSIESYAFYGCSSLKEFVWPESITIIPEYCFYGCESLKELDIPDGVTELGEKAFYGCTGIRHLTVGTGLEYLYEYSSYSSAQTTNGNFTNSSYCPLFGSSGPSTLNSIILKDDESEFCVRGYYYYHYDINYGIVFYREKEGFPLFSNIDVEYYYVGRSLTEISSWSFKSGSGTGRCSISETQPYGIIQTLEIGGYCTEVPYFYQSVEMLILGKDVTEYTVSNIYQGELQEIRCKSTTPAVLDGVFDNATYINTTVYVSTGSLETYQTTAGWSSFWNIKEMAVEDMTPEITDAIPTITSPDAYEIGRYNLQGQKLSGETKGINIIKYSDGTTQKVLVK